MLRPAPARRGRHAARRRRARHRHSRCDRRIHASALPKSLPADPAARADRDRGESISPRSRSFRRRARSGGRASCASRAGSPAGRRGRRAQSRMVAAEINGEIEMPLCEGAFKLRARCRPDRTRCRRRLCHPRLQDRLGADREAGAHRARAAAHARSRDAARRAASTRRSPAGGSVVDAGLCRAQRRRAAGEFKPIEFKEGTPDAQADRALAKLTELVRALRRRARALSFAGPSDVEGALRRLRPSRARQGMVEHRAAKTTPDAP